MRLANPIEIMTGLPVFDTSAIKGKSVFSKDAILYTSASRFSRKETALASKGVLKGTIPSERAFSNSASCHSHGVDASE